MIIYLVCLAAQYESNPYMSGNLSLGTVRIANARLNSASTIIISILCFFMLSVRFIELVSFFLGSSYIKMFLRTRMNMLLATGMLMLSSIGEKVSTSAASSDIVTSL